VHSNPELLALGRCKGCEGQAEETFKRGILDHLDQAIETDFTDQETDIGIVPIVVFAWPLADSKNITCSCFIGVPNFSHTSLRMITT